MKIHEFLTHPDIAFPMQWKNYNSFDFFIQKRLNAFLRLVENLEEGPMTAEAIKARKWGKLKSLCNCIKKTIKHAMQGRVYEAYGLFDEGIQKILNNLEPYMGAHGPDDVGEMYRIRVADNPKFKREELFHIPFEKRHRVATQRYSISGLPCLYLSGSLLACWEEMGRPPFHRVQAAAFRIKKPLKTMLIALDPGCLARYIDSKGSFSRLRLCQKLVLSFIVLWPLIAACSVVVKYRNAPYKPEYIIPQMLLQWVAQNKKIDGITYSSTHVKNTAHYHLEFNDIHFNHVFPAQNVRAKGHCSKLVESFEMTEPQAWQLLDAIDIGQEEHDDNDDDSSLWLREAGRTHEFIESIEEPYGRTKFGQIQAKLDKLPFSDIFGSSDKCVPRFEDGEDF